MNYLSHFVLAERDLAPPVMAAASLLPDMLTYAGATRRTHRVPDVHTCDSPLWKDVCAGMRHHIDVDRTFHSSEFFEARMAESLSWLRAHESSLIEHWSIWLLRHVAIELAIDGWLVRNDETLPERVYASLETVRDEGAALAALELEFATREAGLREYIGSILDSRWLHVYAEPRAVANAIERVFGQLLERRPKLRDLHGHAPVFTTEQWQELPTFVEAVFEHVRCHPLLET